MNNKIKKTLLKITFALLLLLFGYVFWLWAIPKPEKEPEPMVITLGQPEYENTIRVVINKPKGKLTIDDIAWFQNYVNTFYGSARMDWNQSPFDKVYFLCELEDEDALIREERIPFAMYIYLRKNPNNAKLNVEDAKALLNNTADEGTRKALKDYAYWFNGDGKKEIDYEREKLNKAQKSVIINYKDEEIQNSFGMSREDFAEIDVKSLNSNQLDELYKNVK